VVEDEVVALHEALPFWNVSTSPKELAMYPRITDWPTWEAVCEI